ncbi:Regulatory protein ArsR [Tepidanaerobacter acetatoxydans Re1]|uniref:Regulatory protein ArsR n=1 Tax=Tepidanaerobacter acetatoxydans (strain DSM 21804 / JCM 16047 / Re1) TaxID=1209989 RepID=F4LS23_TEPAE|nr:metalloregulator ArsR/SmtB family transcription factor [Tepidanaerobacter acetatoxydans]AEE92362.1 regulatory protein ArsR [Tepidanaerobacter acetatoxydans Re1]CCP27251.1 Regulatory protein ArsR [Tepidanaerobacter acetatoxydans Re1]
MDTLAVIKALGDESRFKIINILLEYNYCVRTLAQELGISEAAVSQHLKVLKEAGLLEGERRGYYMHYDVNRDVLHKLASKIEELAAAQRKPCNLKEKEGCDPNEGQECYMQKTGEKCSDEVRFFCHGSNKRESGRQDANYNCHES